MKNEIEDYIASAYQKEVEEKWKDLYVTDHTPRDTKFHTNNSKEDL